MSSWKLVYALDSGRHPVEGSREALAAAIGAGADLRIGTAFRHNEHIDTSSASNELVRETAEFRATFLVDGHWTAGIMTLRQPISLPGGFGPRPSMSFFLYNEDGTQGIARPHLDGSGPASLPAPEAMPRYLRLDGHDDGTNAPSSNFIYSFEYFRFFVCDRWTEVLSHDAGGRPLSGSVDALAEAFENGRSIKAGIRGLCADLGEGPDHEVFIETGSNYYYTGEKLFIAGAHPLVRVRPAVPLRYESGGWDFGWLMPRSDGLVARWLVDPQGLQFVRSEMRCAIRWFAA